MFQFNALIRPDGKSKRMRKVLSEEAARNPSNNFYVQTDTRQPKSMKNTNRIHWKPFEHESTDIANTITQNGWCHSSITQT